MVLEIYNVERRGDNEKSCVGEFKTLRKYLRQERKSENADDITNELLKMDGRKRNRDCQYEKKIKSYNCKDRDLWRAIIAHVI